MMLIGEQAILLSQADASLGEKFAKPTVTSSVMFTDEMSVDEAAKSQIKPGERNEQVGVCSVLYTWCVLCVGMCNIAAVCSSCVHTVYAGGRRLCNVDNQTAHTLSPTYHSSPYSPPILTPYYLDFSRSVLFSK